MPVLFTLESRIDVVEKYGPGGSTSAEHRVEIDDAGAFFRITSSSNGPRGDGRLSIPLEMVRDLIAAYDATSQRRKLADTTSDIGKIRDGIDRLGKDD